MQNEREKIDDVVVVPGPTEEYLNQRQLEDYRSYRADMIKWMLNLGKNPDKVEGYAVDTVKQRAYQIDKFYRWIWEQEDGYTLKATVELADEYSKELAYEDYSQTHKAQAQKGIKTLFKYFNHERGEDIDWEPEIKFNNGGSTHQVRDFLSSEERRKIKQASLEYGSIPHYDSVDPEERDRWKAHLAQRFEKPKEEVGKEGWERANGWKYPSIIYASMDAGFRPKEIERAKLSWLDLENEMLRIPKDDSTKNTDNWHVALSTRTANILRNWMSERENYDRYNGRDAIWLTQYGNPYNKHSLNDLLKKLCEKANIPIKNRDLTWYSIRHSVGTQMSRDQGPAAVQQQLRQKSYEMAIRYDQAPVDERKKTLNQWD